MANQRIDISQLSLPELQELHQQLSQEVESFTTNMMALQQTAGRFASAGQSIEALKEREEGQPVLIPMTESLYVSGTLDSVETVLLEIGTGYYIEKDIDGGIDYAKRKVNLVRDKVEQLAQIIQTRRAALTQIQAFATEKQHQAEATA
ncbi:hypothetical protein Ndes2526B_g03053 [Nannochloris sp. 'desiccata']|nr:hypothetical protein KSW81_006704 [Chlorella desiccata (nom. nud.)]KAH7622229.1 putative prefoldin subunit 5 [Chlorella desiccata (nom. nud.)]